jgi:SAM-dependent methyltransferase
MVSAAAGTIFAMAEMVIEQKQEWEQAEITRSRFEALHTPTERLVEDERQVVRYLDPPLDTSYPLEYAYALLGNLSGRVVLDFGCGSGQNSLLLARRGARVIGVDISQDLLDLASRRLAVNGVGDRAEFVVGSAHDLPLQDESVDAVLGIAILHHLDLAASAKEVRRVLKPGGVAVFKEPVRDSTVYRIVRKMIPYRQPDVSPYERPLTTAELKSFAAGFNIEAWRAFSLPFVSLVQIAPVLNPYVHPAHQFDKMLLERLPSLAHLSTVRVVALKKPAQAA